MNLKALCAMLRRDGRVASRSLVPLAFQTLLQPTMFVFVFGRVMTVDGLLPPEYKSVLLPGIMVITMVMSGYTAVAGQLQAEFHFTREIEDRLLAPIETRWIAIEKLIVGTLISLASGLVVIPIGWLVMGTGLAMSGDHLPQFALTAILVSMFASALGLTLGCMVGQRHFGLTFGAVLAPMTFFGCTYYPWHALDTLPALQRAVLINPLVYASEGLRSTLVPDFPHMSGAAILAGLLVFNLFFVVTGLDQFRRRAAA